MLAHAYPVIRSCGFVDSRKGGAEYSADRRNCLGRSSAIFVQAVVADVGAHPKPRTGRRFFNLDQRQILAFRRCIKGKLIKLLCDRAPVSHQKRLWLARYLFDRGNAYLFSSSWRQDPEEAYETSNANEQADYLARQEYFTFALPLRRYDGCIVFSSSSRSNVVSQYSHPRCRPVQSHDPDAATLPHVYMTLGTYPSR